MNRKPSAGKSRSAAEQRRKPAEPFPWPKPYWSTIPLSVVTAAIVVTGRVGRRGQHVSFRAVAAVDHGQHPMLAGRVLRKKGQVGAGGGHRTARGGHRIRPCYQVAAHTNGDGLTDCHGNE
jgi:hypothetical protein